MPRKIVRPVIPEKIPFGMIIIPDQPASPLPLTKTTIHCQVAGSLSTVAVTQVFTNPLSSSTELEYLFPLPHRAAIMDFSFQIAERIIQSDLRENDQARIDYEKALDQGQQAALMEQRRPNLFAVRLANIQPGEEILSTIRYQETLPFRDGEYELIIPMGITPKYTSPIHPEDGIGVEVPIAQPDEHIGPVDILISINAGTTLGVPTSPSHKLLLTRLDENRVHVSLADRYIPDHDFVLRLPVAQKEISLSSVNSPHDEADVFLVSILPPAPSEIVQTPAPREFIFVLDRSGSMSGEPIAQARNALKACLRILNPDDTFSILLFDHEIEWFKPQAITLSQQVVDEADRYLSEVEGRGGTEIIPALHAALALNIDKNRTRYIVFLTDGAVSADERTFSEARSQLAGARIFTFGIGPSVNRSLLQKLARIGRGSCEFLQLTEDIEGAILRFQDRVTYPMLTDLQVSCEGGKIWDVYPSTLPDVFSGAPLELVGRIKATGKTPPRLIFQGKQAGQTVKLTCRLLPLPSEEPAVLRAWARARIEDLEEQMDSGTKPFHKGRDEVISLAMEHRLVTQYTSFVAIDSIIVNSEGKPALLRVSQPLPEGLSREGFGSLLAAPAPAYRRRKLSSTEPIIACDYLMSYGNTGNVNHQTGSHQFSRLSSERMILDRTNQSSLKRPDYKPETETVARWLARSQKLDGSWEEGAEFTALALLFWVRNGSTSLKGHFRQQVRRAAVWLEGTKLSGFALFLAALAAHELAKATASPQHQHLAASLLAQLPLPSSLPEEVAAELIAGEPVQAQLAASISTLDELRLARLSGSTISAPDSLLAGPDGDLAFLWSALIP